MPEATPVGHLSMGWRYMLAVEKLCASDAADGGEYFWPVATLMGYTIELTCKAAIRQTLIRQGLPEHEREKECISLGHDLERCMERAELIVLDPAEKHHLRALNDLTGRPGFISRYARTGNLSSTVADWFILRQMARRLIAAAAEKITRPDGVTETAVYADRLSTLVPLVKPRDLTVDQAVEYLLSHADKHGVAP